MLRIRIKKPIIYHSFNNIDSIQNIDPLKYDILLRFKNNVKDKTIDVNTVNKKHCGKEGHWLESQMGLSHNSNNAPDIHGYEMKSEGFKITLGDFSATEYAFSHPSKRSYINLINGWTYTDIISRSEFLQYFGTPKEHKNNRYSWSGECIPKYNVWNICGQMLGVTETDDIVIYYSYSKDMRPYKITFPSFLCKDNIIIAIWKSEYMRKNIENKFNNKGFFICKKNKTTNTFDKLCFGRTLNYKCFINNIKKNNIIFDSGMYEGNSRNYSQFRASHNFWNTLITEEYS